MDASTPPHEPDSASRGTLLGNRYRLREVLAQGGMGVVWAAHDETLGQEVVVKLLGANGARTTSRDRFAREARAAAAVSHPHVVSILDVGTDAETPYLVLERLMGEDLRAFARARQPAHAVVDVALQICAGLSAVHAAGLVHRDLKPSNLFLAIEGGETVLKLLDFGIAKAVEELDADDLTATGVALGSPRYMAPEQIRDASRVDHRADLWSVGVVMFEAATGERPFDGASAAAIGAAVASDPIPDLGARFPDVPAGLARVIERCLAKSPDARFASARALAEALAPHGDSRAATRLAAVVDVVPARSVSSTAKRGAHRRRGDDATQDATDDPEAPAAREPDVTPARPPEVAKVRLPRLAALAVLALAAATLVAWPRGSAPAAAKSGTRAEGTLADADATPSAPRDVEPPRAARTPERAPATPRPPTPEAPAEVPRRKGPPATASTAPVVAAPAATTSATSSPAAPAPSAAGPASTPPSADDLGGSALVDRK